MPNETQGMSDAAWRHPSAKCAERLLYALFKCFETVRMVGMKVLGWLVQALTPTLDSPLTKPIRYEIH
jgi:hypothetical protein